MVYLSHDDNSPLRRFSRQTTSQRIPPNLPNATRAKVQRNLDLLSEYGPSLLQPYAKLIDNDLYELKTTGRPAIRIFYSFSVSGSVILLHAISKKQQKLKNRDIILAKKRGALIDEV